MVPHNLVDIVIPLDRMLEVCHYRTRVAGLLMINFIVVLLWISYLNQYRA
jgi:hypothetical protein